MAAMAAKTNNDQASPIGDWVVSVPGFPEVFSPKFLLPEILDCPFSPVLLGLSSENGVYTVEAGL